MLYHFGQFTLHASEFRLQCEGVTVPLEPKALHVLLFLLTRPGRLVRKQELFDELWPDVAVTDNALTRCITLLRRALADDSRTPSFIETVPRVGYRFVAAVTTEIEPATEAAIRPTPASPEERTHPPTHTALARQLTARRARIFVVSIAAAGIVVVVLVSLAVKHRTVPIVGASRTSPVSTGASSDNSSEDAIPTEAREQYQRGLYYYDRRNAVASTAAFRRSIELAPRYAPAYAGLAMALDSRALLSNGVPGKFIPDAVAAAKKGIALDPSNGEAYLALGSIQSAFTWQWSEAEQNLTRGLTISPQNATGHMWYAILLQELGRTQKAMEQANQAVALAPLSFFMVRMQGSILYYARHYDDAVRALELAHEMQPQHPEVVDNWISWADEQRGLYDDAVSYDLLASQGHITPGQAMVLRSIYRRSGWRAYWEARLQQMPPAAPEGCNGYAKGVIHLRIGDREAALTALKDAAVQHCFWMGMVQVDPVFDSVREDPRFKAIEQLVDGTSPSSPGAGPQQRPAMSVKAK